MNNLKQLTITLFLIFITVACQPQNQIETESNPEIEAETVQNPDVVNLTPTPYIFATSMPGNISIRGVLVVMNPLTALPDPNDAIFLVPMPAGGENITSIPPIDEQSVQAQVDEASGKFFIINVKPGQYAMVVREKSGAEIPVRYGDKDSMVILTLEEADINQIIDLGYLRFP